MNEAWLTFNNEEQSYSNANIRDRFHFFLIFSIEIWVNFKSRSESYYFIFVLALSHTLLTTFNIQSTQAIFVSMAYNHVMIFRFSPGSGHLLVFTVLPDSSHQLLPSILILRYGT